MRHRKSGKKLGRTWEHRKAMFRNMAKSLIVHERIRTTAPKASELSRVMDRLVTLAIRNDLSARRQAYKILENHKLVQRLFNEIGPRFSNGQGGYTRVVKFAKPRVGDSACMALIEFAYPGELTEPAVKSAAAPAAEAVPSAAPVTAEPAETKAEADEQALVQEQAEAQQEVEEPETSAAPDSDEPAAEDAEAARDEPEEAVAAFEEKETEAPAQADLQEDAAEEVVQESEIEQPDDAEPEKDKK